MAGYDFPVCSVEVVREQLVNLLDEKQRLRGAWMLDEKEIVSCGPAVVSGSGAARHAL